MGTLSRRRLESHDGRWIARPFYAGAYRCADCWIGNEPKEEEDYVMERALEEGMDGVADERGVQYTLESSRRGVSV